MNQYSDKTAGEIADIFHGKRWNFYRADRVDKIGVNEMIMQDLSDKLEKDVPYILFPVADDPRDPVQVGGMLIILLVKLGLQSPTIKLGDVSYPLTALTLRERDVKIHTPVGTNGIYVLYPDFIKSLDSIVDNTFKSA